MSMAIQGSGAIPSYSYHYPSRSIRLTAVKHGIFNPRLPSFRQMDRDTNMNLLPDEHCRTSTSLGPADFHHANSSILQPGKITLNHLPITAQGKDLLVYGPDIHRKRQLTDLEIKREQWKDELVRIPEKFSVEMREGFQPPECRTSSGYALRYLRPEVTSSWQYTLQQAPSLDQFGQRPVPTNIYARYRDNHHSYSRDAATQAWD